MFKILTGVIINMDNNKIINEYFFVYQGTELNPDEIKMVLEELSWNIHKVNFQHIVNKHLIMANQYLVNDNNAKLEDIKKSLMPYYDETNNIMGVMSYYDEEINNWAIPRNYMKDNNNQIITNQYADIDDDFFLYFHNYLHFCSVFYDFRKDILLSGVTTPNNKYTHLYFSYTEKNKELIFSNNSTILSYFCKTIFELPPQTFIKNGKFYDLDNKELKFENLYPNAKELLSSSNHSNTKINNINSKLSKFGICLTRKKYLENPAIGRDREIRDLSKKLLIPKTGVVLVGEAGVGKTSIVEGLSYQIQNNTVCNLLKDKIILSVNISELLAGCKYRGDFEKVITDLCGMLAKENNVILFIDEMHVTLGAGSSTENSLDMANMLKTYISNEQIKVIGCTTVEEYKNYFSSDKAFRRRFRVLNIEEPSKDIIKDILISTISLLSKKFKIEVQLSNQELNNLLEIIISLSHRPQKYTLEQSKNPDESINILTECFAYCAIENIQLIKYQDMIDGLIDNSSLELIEQEIKNLLYMKNNSNMEIDDKMIQKAFSKKYIKNN